MIIFNHSFFNKNDNQKLPFFNFKCNNHLKNVNYYCKNCKLNICVNCLDKHKNHQVVSFSEIGLNNEEISIIYNSLNEIENKLNIFNQIKNDIELFLVKMTVIKENITIYENDNKNNFKEYYIDWLRYMEKKIEIEDMKIYIKKEDKWLDGINYEKELLNKANIPTLICSFEQSNEEQKAYCIKLKDNFLHEKSIKFEIKSVPQVNFSIKFKVNGKIHEIQNTFDNSEEALFSTLYKAYDLLK